MRPADALTVTINPRARRIALRVDLTARAVVLSLPRAADRAEGERLVAKHAQWIDAQLARLPPARPFREGADIPLRGDAHVLARSGARGRARVIDAAPGGAPPMLDVPAQPEAFAGRVKRALIALAREDLDARARVHADALGREIKSLHVKDTRSRWGSCARGGVLSFSWRLVCAPPDVLDYVAAHEAAHLIEANHGPRFWALVDRVFGDCRAQRTWLRENGPALFAVGAET